MIVYDRKTNRHIHFCDGCKRVFTSYTSLKVLTEELDKIRSHNEVFLIPSFGKAFERELCRDCHRIYQATIDIGETIRIEIIRPTYEAIGILPGDVLVVEKIRQGNLHFIRFKEYVIDVQRGVYSKYHAGMRRGIDHQVIQHLLGKEHR